MSIDATLWQLKFPKDGDDYIGCEWMTVTAQGVPPHIGSPTQDAAMKTVTRTQRFCPRPYTQICSALRSDKPRVVAQYLAPAGCLRILFEDGTSKECDM